jgi:pimeloyl-ACP methyl ester carboxylesterase
MRGRTHKPNVPVFCRGVALFVAALFLAASAAADALAALPAMGFATLSDGRKIALRCGGSGSPTVVFEGGYGADSGAWYKVQPQVAKTHRACSYDRAGYGASDPGPLPRDGASVAKDLDLALRKAKIAGPFVLVGHSAGALYIRLFAARRSRDVAGFVFVDPSIEHQDRRMAELFGPGSGSMRGQHDRAAACLAAVENSKVSPDDPLLKSCGQTTTAALWRAKLSEADTLWGASSDQIDAAPRFSRRIPVIVLTADGTYASAPRSVRPSVDTAWRLWHREIAALSDRGEERLVTGSSHLMMLDRPDAVAAAISDVIALATERRKPGK